MIGRRKSWHLIGFLCVFLSFPFIFSLCIECSDAHQYAQIVYFGSFMIIFQFGWASTQISHLAMIPDLAKIPSDRTELTAIRYTMTNLSTIFVYLIGKFKALRSYPFFNLLKRVLKSTRDGLNYGVSP